MGFLQPLVVCQSSNQIMSLETSSASVALRLVSLFKWVLSSIARVWVSCQDMTQIYFQVFGFHRYIFCPNFVSIFWVYIPWWPGVGASHTAAAEFLPHSTRQLTYSTLLSDIRRNSYRTLKTSHNFHILKTIVRYHTTSHQEYTSFWIKVETQFKILKNILSHAIIGLTLLVPNSMLVQTN